MSVAVKRLEGVESVDLSLQRAVADIRLREGNGVTLDQVRQIVKETGFSPKEAVVTAVGRPVDRAGKPGFEVSGITTVLLVAPARTAPALVRQLTDALSKPSALAEITGTVELKSDGTNEVVLTTFLPKP